MDNGREPSIAKILILDALKKVHMHKFLSPEISNFGLDGQFMIHRAIIK